MLCPDSACGLSIHNNNIAELLHCLKKLYEDYALDKISEERFEKLSAEYEQELDVLTVACNEEKQRITEAEESNRNADRFLEIANRYIHAEELTDEMIEAFVEKIIVHHRSKDENGRSTRRIEIILKFIGNFEIPQEAFAEESVNSKEKKPKKVKVKQTKEQSTE